MGTVVGVEKRDLWVKEGVGAAGLAVKFGTLGGVQKKRTCSEKKRGETLLGQESRLMNFSTGD